MPLRAVFQTSIAFKKSFSLNWASFWPKWRDLGDFPRDFIACRSAPYSRSVFCLNEQGSVVFIDSDGLDPPSLYLMKWITIEIPKKGSSVWIV